MKDAILGSLEKVKGPDSKGEYQALCPFHPDRNPSLSVNFEKGVYYCQGCQSSGPVTRLAQRLGVNCAISANPNKEDRLIVATYDYSDAEGKLVHQTVRYLPKDFSQRRPDGKGGWIWNLKGITPVLYHLPEVLEAVKKGETVHVCEGEKDAENLRKLGLVATTNPMGAGKWRPEYGDVLSGASVVILPDNDEAGRKHADQVARSLTDKVTSVRLVKLPGLTDKGDVSDWLRAGGTREELERLVGEGKPYQGNEGVDNTNVVRKEVRDAEKSFLDAGRRLYEEIYRDGQVAFLEYDIETGDVTTVPEIVHDGSRISPQQGEEIRMEAIKLPSGVSEYESTLSLLQAIEWHIDKYLDLSKDFKKFASYYILLSWLYDKFSTLPYLRFLGDTGCGKSRALDTVGGLCYRPTMASGCVTPAPIYRLIKRWAGTVIIDEADLRDSDEYSEVIKILNCGFEKGRPVIRATKDNPDKLQYLPTFGPKVFATRRRFDDPALEARCLTEVMQETTRDDIPPTVTSAFYREQEEIRNKLLLFRFRNYSKVKPEESVTLDLPGIEPRLKQISACFASLFAGQPDVLVDYQAFIQNHQRELIDQRASTAVGRIVEALFSLTESDTLETLETIDTTGQKLLRISAGDIATKVNMTPQVVGQILKTLGLTTKPVKVSGSVKRCIVLDKVKLDTLRKRYIPPDEAVAMVSKVSSLLGYSQPDTGGSSEMVKDVMEVG